MYISMIAAVIILFFIISRIQLKMFCSKCGNKILLSLNKFCSLCGTSLPEVGKTTVFKFKTIFDGTDD